MSELPEMLTAKEVAKLLKMHVTTVCRLAKRNKLPGTQEFGDWRFDKEEMSKVFKKAFNRPKDISIKRRAS